MPICGAEGWDWFQTGPGRHPVTRVHVLLRFRGARAVTAWTPICKLFLRIENYGPAKAVPFLHSGLPPFFWQALAKPWGR